MLCPHCGPHGHLEQVEFSEEYERYYCSVCHITYVAYPLGNGEFTEPVPVKGHPDAQKSQPHFGA